MLNDRRSATGLPGWRPVPFLAWLLILFLAAASADMLPLPPPDRMHFEHVSSPPGTIGTDVESGACQVFLLGTDTLGRDILSRLIHGARVALLVGLISPAVGMLAGGMLGILAGFIRGRTETVIVMAMDTVLAFPGLVLLLAVSFYFGQGIVNLVLILGFFTVPAFCRVARAKTLSLAGMEFVQAARMMGATHIRVMACDIFPNIFVALMIYALYVAARIILVEGALSFLSLGVPPPMPSWGGMIACGREVLEEAPFVTLIPSAALFLTVLSLNLLGDFLQTRLESRERQI